MDNRINIYCEFAFFEKFADLCPQTKNGIPHKDYKHWECYFDMFCGKNDIVITDIEKKEFISQCNDDSIAGQILKLILESHADGRGNLVCLSNEKTNMETHEQDDNGLDYFSKHEQTIFFLNQNEETCRYRENNYGLIFISPETLLNRAELLFTPQRYEINENTKNWSFLKKNISPCNTIYLIDNYILGKESSIIENNIKSLFDAILPSILNKRSFKVIVSTEIPKGQDEQWANKRAEKLKRWIEELRSYKIEVFINYTKNKHHDRNLFSNYFLFDCGYGFILSENEKQKGTKLTIFPITHRSTLAFMQSFKDTINK
ncbi:hypothetical protein [Bacteroides sp. 519]|uniref:hypothetical protein n=1 Tax=Bacteroides sp. 519 TaxID=2302937 RepID=UPI0013D446AD|nr:hypothetical protein [Bacteroides sp. 519]NDV59288.1 hypothetical protein [Bacteroides sp. 519]